MFLKLYPLNTFTMPVVPAVRTRPWMKLNPHVFKCGPVANCNSFGWDILTSVLTRIEWHGGKSKNDLLILEGAPYCHTNFGHGVATFAPGYTWHTSPGWSLLVCPVPNAENDDWSTMWAMVETDTLKYPFFPSIQLKKPGTYELPAGTAIARVIPIQQDEVMACEPTIEHEPQDFREYRQWQAQEREKEMANKTHKWQKFYHDIADFPVVRMKELKDARTTTDTEVPNGA